MKLKALRVFKQLTQKQKLLILFAFLMLTYFLYDFAVTFSSNQLLENLIDCLLLVFCLLYIFDIVRVFSFSSAYHFFNKALEEEDKGSFDEASFSIHAFATFLLPFFLVFLDSIEILTTLSSLQNPPEELTKERVWGFVSYEALEASLITLIAIEITTLYFLARAQSTSKASQDKTVKKRFMRRQANSLIRTVITSLIIAASIDIALFVLLKTVVAQPNMSLVDIPGIEYQLYHSEIYMLFIFLGLLSFVSSFSSIHMAESYMDLRLSGRLKKALKSNEKENLV